MWHDISHDTSTFSETLSLSPDIMNFDFLRISHNGLTKWFFMYSREYDTHSSEEDEDDEEDGNEDEDDGEGEGEDEDEGDEREDTGEGATPPRSPPRKRHRRVRDEEDSGMRKPVLVDAKGIPYGSMKKALEDDIKLFARELDPRYSWEAQSQQVKDRFFKRVYAGVPFFFDARYMFGYPSCIW